MLQLWNNKCMHFSITIFWPVSLSQLRMGPTSKDLMDKSDAPFRRQCMAVLCLSGYKWWNCDSTMAFFARYRIWNVKCCYIGEQPNLQKKKTFSTYLNWTHAITCPNKEKFKTIKCLHAWFLWKLLYIIWHIREHRTSTHRWNLHAMVVAYFFFHFQQKMATSSSRIFQENNAFKYRSSMNSSTGNARTFWKAPTFVFFIVFPTGFYFLCIYSASL